MSDEQIALFTADDMPYGKTYGNWTVKWWQWVLGIPKSVNPVVDRTGEYTAMNQQNSDVFFLAGKLAEEESSLPQRYCSVSTKTSILVPVINCESNRLESPGLKTHKDIVDRVRDDEDTIIRTQCYLDGKRIPTQRIISDPEIFEVHLVEDNLFDVKGGGTTHASADGYWAFLKRLAKGEHTISFEGSCENGRLHSGALYKLDVR
jgi:hypothetical protein